LSEAGVNRQRAPGLALGFPERIRYRIVEEERHPMRECRGAVGARKSRITPHRLPEELYRAAHVLLGALRQPGTGAQVELIRLEIPGGGLLRHAVHRAVERASDRLHDGAGELILEREQVAEIAVVGLRPEVIAALSVDELHCETDAISGTAYAA